MAYRRFQWPEKGDVVELRRYPKGQVGEVPADVVVTGRVELWGEGVKESIMVSPVDGSRFDVIPEKFGQQYAIWDTCVYVRRKEFRARWDWSLVERSAANEYARALRKLQNTQYSVADLKRRQAKLQQQIRDAQANLTETEVALREDEKLLRTLEASIPDLQAAADIRGYSSSF